MTMIILLITMNIVMSARMEEEVCATTLAQDRSLVSPRPPHMPGIVSRVRFPINPLATCQLGKLTLETIPGI